LSSVDFPHPRYSPIQSSACHIAGKVNVISGGAWVDERGEEFPYHSGGKTYEQNEGQPADSGSFEVKQKIDIRHDKNAGAQVVEMTAKKSSCPTADQAFQPEGIDEVEQEYSDQYVRVCRNFPKERYKTFPKAAPGLF